MTWLPTDAPLLLLSDNTDGDQVFVDVGLHTNAPHDIITNGAVAHRTDAPGLSGVSSIYFPGTTSDYLTIIDDIQDFNVGTNDWCFDFRWRNDGAGVYGGIICRRADSNYTAFTIFNIGAGLYVTLSSATGFITNQLFIGATSLTEFRHFAVVHSGNDYYTFGNGFYENTVTDARTVEDSDFPIGLGCFDINQYPGKGWLDQCRFVIGSDCINDPEDPMYISSGNPVTGFTPTTVPYPTFSIRNIACDKFVVTPQLLCTDVTYRTLAYPRVGRIELPAETYWLDESNYSKNTLQQKSTLTGSLVIEQIYPQKGFRPITLLSKWCSLEIRQALEELRDIETPIPMTIYTGDGRGPFQAFFTGADPITWVPVPFIRPDYQTYSPSLFDITIKLITFDGDIIS